MEYTKKEFATLAGMPTNQLAVFLNPSRSKVILNESGKIDDKNDINRAFIEHRIAQGKADDQAALKYQPGAKVVPVTRTKVKAVKAALVDDDEQDDDDLDGVPQLHVSERRLKYLKTLTEKKKHQREDLEMEKIRGGLIPTDIISTLFYQYGHALMTSFKQTADRILAEFAHKYDVTPADTAGYRGDIIKHINKCMADAQTTVTDGLENVVNEYAKSKNIESKNTIADFGIKNAGHTNLNARKRA
jgi:hypothetical protein